MFGVMVAGLVTAAGSAVATFAPEIKVISSQLMPSNTVRGTDVGVARTPAPHVHEVRDSLQVGSIHAQFVSAQVVNGHPCRNWPLTRFIRKAVGWDLLSGAEPEDAIAAMPCKPSPAVIGFALLNLSPEASACWLGGSPNLHSHSITQKATH